ncbi:MAG TPA: glycosyl hydrolase [Acholeplasmataceae bacterium]|nr:glycosyl hydrolase [Acholeplasmataceae bacterium]
MKLTYEEKAALLDGADVWHTKAFKDFPSIMMADGPHGLRKQLESTDTTGISGSVKSTCFPTASLTACSFDRNLIARMAKLIALEAQTNQVNIILGPGINIKRSPLCGRNFEYFSEDPFLAGELGASFVRSMESQGTGTSIKHFFCNNQEKYRFTADSIVDERAMREIYLKAFERVIKENPATIMASYNKINGIYATEHPVLKEVLRKEWGYQGVIVSDWGAIHHRTNSVKASCDLEMPSSLGYNTKNILKDSLLDQDLRKEVENSAKRIENLVNRYDRKFYQTYDPKKHHAEARVIASESMVLLKNDGILPLTKKDKVAFIGGFIRDIRYQGGGSSHINPNYLDQIADIRTEYSENTSLAKGFELNQDVDVDILIQEAVEVSKKVDKVVLILGLPESHEAEGFDREDLNIPKNQLKLLQEILLVNKNVVVVAVGGSVINLEFESKIKGLLMAYLGGQAASHAILDILYGNVNPSGRLAETFIDDVNQCNVQLTDDNNAVYYEESIFVGYRYYETFNQHVRYPFGYGLSYTNFKYSNFQIKDGKNEFTITFNLKNEGKIKGKEVIQLYIGNNASTVYKAKRELKEFDKIELNAGEEKEVTLRLSKDAFKYYDVNLKKWTIQKGTYHIELAKNARDILYSNLVKLNGEEIFHEPTSYLNTTYDVKDFPKIYKNPLPKKNIVKKRPYDLSSTLNDIRRTVIGRVISSFIIKAGMKTTELMADEWMKEVTRKTIVETPIRMLSLFSAGKFRLGTAQGMIDIINLKFVKGIRKINKDAKEKKRHE